MEIPDEMLKEIRESGYDQKLVYNYIRELLNSDKKINENNNLELIDNYLLDKDLQETCCWGTDGSRANRQLLIR